jgi:hypothetical protein
LILDIVVLFICAGLSGCIIGPKNYIEAIRVDEEPDVYINMTEQQMKNYPSLKKAIELEGNLTEIPLGTIEDYDELFESNDTHFIKYRNIYYNIRFACSD